MQFLSLEDYVAVVAILCRALRRDVIQHALKTTWVSRKGSLQTPYERHLAAMPDDRLDFKHGHLNGGLMTKRPTRIITCAWGERYVHQLLSLTLPALLAPGNLPSVAASVPCELVILTEEGFFATVNTHPSILRTKEFCSLRLIDLDDLIISGKDKYGMA